MIDGIIIKELKVIPDERGRLMEILRSDDKLFERFGQVYVTTTYPGVVKAWHLHRRQSDNICCILGMIKLAVYDARKDSPTFKEINPFYLGIHRPLLIRIPPGVYHGWMCISPEEAVIVNTPTKAYDYKNPDEKRLDPFDKSIPFDWRRKDG